MGKDKKDFGMAGFSKLDNYALKLAKSPGARRRLAKAIMDHALGRSLPTSEVFSRARAQRPIHDLSKMIGVEHFIAKPDLSLSKIDSDDRHNQDQAYVLNQVRIQSSKSKDKE